MGTEERRGNKKLIDLIIRWAVPFILGGAASGLVAYIKTTRRKETALERGVQCLLRAEIIRAHKEYIEKGCVPIYAKQALTRAYNAYHALGGNDVATQLYQEVMNLPIM